jgi:AcrR family transcriptional regulator
MSSQKADTRERILDAALEILGKPGGHAVSMEQVAAKAGISRQAVYLHFESRSNLLMAAAARGNERVGLARKREELCGLESADAMLEAWVDLLSRFLPATLTLAVAMEIACREDKELARAWESRSAHRMAVCRRLVERFQAEGRLAKTWTVDRAAEWVCALCSHPLYEELCLRRGWSKADWRAMLAASLRGGLTGGKAS